MINNLWRLLARTVPAMVGLVGAWPGHAAELSLELPVACEIGTLCTIQKYVDHDPGPGRLDYACGRLSSDGHKGTDFRVPDYPAMERGVAVVAPAPGVVRATRDGMRDISVREIGVAALAGRLAGNSVVIDHGGGWETQYGHLKSGSVAVRQGDQVSAGQRLGLIGLSGAAEFPHMHFEVRFAGDRVDPFVGRNGFADCNDPRDPLWSAAALAVLDYTPAGPLTTGFATDRPAAAAARRGQYRGATISTAAPALVFWADVYGTLAGDVQSVAISGPDGQLIHTTEDVLEANNISWFAFSGRRRPAAGWPTGDYEGRYTLSRAGRTLFTTRATVRLVPDR